MSLRKVVDQFSETVRKLSKLQKVSLFAAAVAVVSSVIALVIWANKPVYKTLYSDINENDVRQISEALDGKNIPYKIVGGKNIEIPSGDVYATRIALAEEGLPRDQGVGFEIFNDSKLGMTRFQQDVAYQRALQGELSRSISSLNEVAEAKVHIFIASDKIFNNDDEDSKASVVVRLASGRGLTQEQVKAITHLVASAVRGLKPQNVQVLDTNGNLLSEFMDDDDSSTYVTNNQLKQQRQIERDLEKKLQGLLSKTVGSDSYVVKVSVDMDFSKKEITREEFGDSPVLRSQQSYEKKASGKGSEPSGIPGVESNLAEPDLFVDNILKEFSESSETQNFEISKIITHERKNAGEIRRLTVSVVVDDKIESSSTGGVTGSTKVPRTPDELNRIRTAVASAVGFNSTRGDIVDVTNISFDSSSSSSAISNERREKIMGWLSVASKYIGALVILFLFYFILIRPILKRLDNAPDVDDESLGETATDAQLASLDITIGDESGFPKTVEDLEREIESELNESVPVDVEAVKSKVMLKKIEEASVEDPEMVANLVKALIKGG